jgi:hypothetical protein
MAGDAKIRIIPDQSEPVTPVLESGHEDTLIRIIKSLIHVHESISMIDARPYQRGEIQHVVRML